MNHSGFTTRDELEYQFARQQRENELMNQYKSQGMMENFPQYGVNFWGNSANNYGFGLSDIAGNIRGMNKVTTPIPIGSEVPRIQNMQQPHHTSQIACYNNQNNISYPVLLDNTFLQLPRYFLHP